MRTLTKVVFVVSMGLLSAIAACSGGDDQNDAGSDSGSDAPLKKDAGNKDAVNDVAVICTADTSYSAVTNQSATYTPTPVDGGTDAAADATADANVDATADADDGGNADADDGSADADDGSAEGGGADASTDAGGGPIGGPMDFYQYTGDLNADPDVLDVEIYAGFGVFTNGIKTGTFNLTGAELDYATCGLCVLVLTDTSGGSATDTYMATGGTVTIDTISPTTISGSLSNVTFTHVTIDANTFESTPVGDGCNSSISSLSISAAVTQK